MYVMGNVMKFDESGEYDGEDRVDDHLEQALESSENEQTKYHIREALGLLRLD